MGSKPRKPRAKSPSKVGQGKHPQKAPKNNYFATLMQTEEGRALRRQWSKKPRKNAGRPRGVPDGYSKKQIEPIRAKVKTEAKKVVEIMAKESPDLVEEIDHWGANFEKLENGVIRYLFDLLYYQRSHLNKV